MRGGVYDGYSALGLIKNSTLLPYLNILTRHPLAALDKTFIAILQFMKPGPEKSNKTY
jgi:hypothetical protein